MLNTIEKRKIEGVIAQDIKSKKEAYILKRKSEYDALQKDLQKTPPKKITEMYKKIKSLREEAYELEMQVNSLGWEANTHGDGYLALKSHYNWRKENDGGSFYTHEAKELLSHKEETDLKVSGFETLARNYCLKIYAGGQEMEDLLKQMEKDIANLMK